MGECCDLLVLLLWVRILILLKGKWTVSNQGSLTGHRHLSLKVPNVEFYSVLAFQH